MKANLQKCNILPLIHTMYLFKMCKIKTHITINEYQKWQAIENKNKYMSVSLTLPRQHKNLLNVIQPQDRLTSPRHQKVNSI